MSKVEKSIKVKTIVKAISLFFICLIFFVAGYILHSYQPTTKDESDTQGIAMKLQCSKLVDDYFSQIEEDSAGYNSYSAGSRRENNMEPTVCYSEDLNTCVAIYETWLDDVSVSEWGDTIMKTVVAYDLLAHDSLYTMPIFKASFGTEEEKEIRRNRDTAAHCPE
ncbi:MAG: hypothetical protein NUV56_04870 [Candidatus Uhrbacteria bacterium]|nr:hypothetical protein [Candidatus Uhrbacteria bacterium]